MVNKPNYIVPLSSIDGALMCDFEGNCLGIGTILDGVAVARGELGRGARFNSTLNYIAWKKHETPQEEYVAAIISEDGTLDIFSTTLLDLHKYEPDFSNG